MGSQPNPSPRFLFGPFEFEQLSGDLFKFGNRIALRGKPLQILTVLLDQPGQVIGRDELQRHLWKGTIFVDFEQGLNTAVNKLRNALGDSADQPRYIETVPGKGYRFIAPLKTDSLKAVLELVPAPALRIEPAVGVDPAFGKEPAAGAIRIDPLKFISRPRRRLWWQFVGGAALIVIAGGFWLTASRTEFVAVTKPATFAVAPPPGFVLEAGASRQSFALSPDGTHLAFTAMDKSGTFSAFVRDFNSLEPRLLPRTEGVHTLFWAPDGLSLFLTVRGKLQRASLEDNPRVVLGESPGFLLSGAWLRSSSLLLGASSASYLIAPSGGTPQLLSDVYRWPQILPDGEHILYVTTDSQNYRHRARVAQFGDLSVAAQPTKSKDSIGESPTGRDLIESDSRVLYTASLANPGTGYLMYVRAGSLLAQPFDPHSLRVFGEAIPVVDKVYSFRPTGAADFSVSGSGTLAYQSFVSRSQLVWVDRLGKQVTSAGPAGVNLKSGRLSPDGRKLAIAIFDLARGAQNLWIVDIKSNAVRELTLQPGLRDAPVWSPDSKTLAFMHSSGKPPQIHIRGAGETDAETTLPITGFQMPTDWSPDGRFIVFQNTGMGALASEIQSDVFMIDLSHGRKVIPILSTGFDEANAAFSPDGKWLTFTSNESGRSEVYVQAFESTGLPHVTGERYLVTRSGAQALRWRRDGKELFYLSWDGRVYAVPARFSPKPEFGAATPLFTISAEARGAIHSVLSFDVSPDGRQFLIPAVNHQEGSSLVVMQNWEAALTKNRFKSSH